MYTAPTLHFYPIPTRVEAGSGVAVSVRLRHGSAIYALSLVSDPTCSVFVSHKRVLEHGSLWHAVDAYATESLVTSERNTTGEFLRNKLRDQFERCHRIMEHLYL